MSSGKILRTLQQSVWALNGTACADWMLGYSSKKSGYRACAASISEGSIT